MAQSFAHISDPHLTGLDQVSAALLLNKRLLGYLSWRRKRRAEHQSHVLRALVHDLKQGACDQLLITGDLTHIGLPQEFEAAGQWLSSLGDPQHTLVVPGNHDACVDIPWSESLAHWEPYMVSDTPSGGKIPSVVGGHALFPSLRIRQGIAFIGLNSACPTAPLMATGTLGQQQLARLDRLLRETAGQDLFRVVFLHHPPLPGTEKWRKRLTDAPALRDLLVEHGAELVLHGHGHRAQHHSLQTRAGEVLVNAVPSASALGLHGADIAAYNRYAVCDTPGGWELAIECRRYSDSQQRFNALPTQRIEVVRNRPGKRL